MPKTILITGSTDGIGLEAAKLMAKAGHNILLHGRSATKLKQAKDLVSSAGRNLPVGSYIADLSIADEIKALANAISADHQSIEVVVNNAGVFKAAEPIADNGLDVRFMVNTIAPCLLTKYLLRSLGKTGRVVSLSSAAQTSVDLDVMTGNTQVSDMDAYSQSKLALTMWSAEMAKLHVNGPIFIAVNPGSLLGSKMVKEGFGIDGRGLDIGAEIIAKLATEEQFSRDSGKYFDNDLGKFSAPHIDAMDAAKSAVIFRFRTY